MIMNGKITPDQYKGYMLKQLEKDKKLLNFFTANGLEAKAQIVKERMTII